MTRARKRLVLTGAARRRVFGEYKSSEPSRFIDEVPADLLERQVPSFSSSSSYQSTVCELVRLQAEPVWEGWPNRRQGA